MKKLLIVKIGKSKSIHYEGRTYYFGERVIEKESYYPVLVLGKLVYH